MTSVAACTPTSTIASLAEPVEGGHRLDDVVRALLGLQSLLDGGGDHAGPDRLGEEQHVARQGTDVADDLLGMHDAHYREPELGLLVVDGVAADGDRACLGDLLGTAAHDLPDDVRPHRAREREEVHRGERPPPIA